MMEMVVTTSVAALATLILLVLLRHGSRWWSTADLLTPAVPGFVVLWLSAVSAGVLVATVVMLTPLALAWIYAVGEMLFSRRRSERRTAQVGQAAVQQRDPIGGAMVLLVLAGAILVALSKIVGSEDFQFLARLVVAFGLSVIVLQLPWRSAPSPVH